MYTENFIIELIKDLKTPIITWFVISRRLDFEKRKMIVGEAKQNL